MKVVGRALVLVLLGLAPVGETAAAGPTSTTSSAPTFEQLVEAGNQARVGRRWAEAVIAYSDALKLRDDLTVVGRLGLALFKLGEHAAAASQLHRALEEPNAGASPAERVQFVTAYDVTRREVCRLDVRLDRTGARVELDGRVVQEGPADFWLFVAAGKHELRAALEGFEEETKTIEVPRGGRKPVEFTMKAKATPAVQVDEPRVEPTPPPPAPVAAPARKEPAPRSAPSNSAGHVGIGAGVAAVFGATPGAAVGPQIFGAWRRGWFSVGLEGRAAWGLKETKNLQFMSWTVTASPCAHWRAWFGCVLVQADWLQAPAPALIRTGGQVGLGVRGGVEFFPQAPVRLRIWGDAVARTSGIPVRANNQPIWLSSAIVGSLVAGGVVTF
ncbi:PEGA domain-containing protein [Polyangium fumosum]|uniref:PEGA domain-containing protein n=1 Tax=Polyangium fumosum TaxID=889272 RepID=A0A4V5PL05_9BACT|nr:PEGA domain-containing protein [Polyangium fumosum]TKC94588.1 PEGA domain-containing protein [Polyangium fumosum]